MGHDAGDRREGAEGRHESCDDVSCALFGLVDQHTSVIKCLYVHYRSHKLRDSSLLSIDVDSLVVPLRSFTDLSAVFGNLDRLSVETLDDVDRVERTGDVFKRFGKLLLLCGDA